MIKPVLPHAPSNKISQFTNSHRSSYSTLVQLLWMQSEFPIRLVNLFSSVKLTGLSIVFVHGLSGDEFLTWQSPITGTTWPQSLLWSYSGLNGASIRALSFGYNGNPQTPFFFPIFTTNTISTNASNLLNELANARSSVDVCALDDLSLPAASWADLLTYDSSRLYLRPVDPSFL
jgi:hypothetical protein